ncbi:DUF6636 domain-containing protein [Haemophilus sp.]|uniref:DUF6636 domain-containing protein n=1 Tax=Haemophilus sp. TaxID=740 RepID=UPI003520F0B6
MKKLFVFALCTFSVSSFALTPRVETASNSDSFISFRTANDAIYCSGDIPGLNPKVECVTTIKGKPILPRPKDCEFEWGELFSVGATGKASLVCASDTPAVPDSQILKDGETIKGKGWQCTASGDSLTCSNQEKHGFKISQVKQKLF